MHSPRLSLRNDRRPTTLNGFSLLDFLVVLSMIGILLAIMLPAISASQEDAKRLQCQDNLKQIGISLHNYHDTYLTFPIGTRGAGYTKQNARATQDYASSWYVGLLPFFREDAVADRWDHKAGNGFDGGDPADPKTNMQLVDGFAPKWIRCPSSPLPMFVLIGKHGTTKGRVLPTYVGIAGGVTQNGWKYQDRNRVQSQTGSARGIQASNGILFANDSVRIADIRDGTSNTIVVGEQSDFHSVGPNQTKQIANSGATVGAWCGAKGYGIIGEPSSSQSNPIAWNVTTVRYPVQHNKHDTLPDGIFAPSDTKTLGNNNGIFSAHESGAFCLFTDGRIRFVSEEYDLQTLTYASIRADRQAFELPAASRDATASDAAQPPAADRTDRNGGRLVFNLRTWTDKTGKHKIIARFVEIADKKVVVLRLASGEEKTIELSQLSNEDLYEAVRSDLLKQGYRRVSAESPFRRQ